MAVPLTTAMQNQIANLYISILGRNPDPVGFGYWCDVYANANGTQAALDAIASGFGKSPEFTGIYSGQTVVNAVALMYNNILGRTQDATGATYWQGVASNYITSGKTIGDAYALTANAMITAAAANTGTADATLIASKQTTAVTAGTSSPVTTYTLTTTVDTTSADVINGILGATGATWTAFDTITGNGRAKFNLVDSTAAAFGAASIPGGSTTSGLSTVSLNRAAVAGATSIAVIIGNTTFGTGVQNLSVIESGAATTAGAAAVTLNSARTVSVVSTGAQKFDGITITDTGTGTSRGSTLTTVTLQGSSNTANAVHGNAITTINLNDNAAAVGATVINSSAGTRAITVNASGTVASGGLTDAEATSATLNVSGAAAFGTLTVAKATAVTINATAATSVTLSAAVATTLNLGGTKSLAMTMNTTPAVTSIVVTGAGGVSADVSAITTLVGVDTTGSTAVASTANSTIANAFTLATTQGFTGGAGSDQITVGATTKALTLGDGANQATVGVTALGTGGSITAGSGTADVLVLSNANAATITGTAATAAAFKAAVTGFEILDAGTATAVTISASSFGTFSTIRLVGAGVAQVLSGVTSGLTIETTFGAAYTSLTTNTLSNPSDVLNLGLKGDLSGGARAFGVFVTPGVETVNFVLNDTNTTFTTRLATAELTDVGATTINISGNNGLALTMTAGGTSVTTFNAGGVTKGAVTYTALALTNNVVVTGSATGADVLDFNAATGTVTMTAGSGGGTYTGATAAVVNTITGGTGNDTIIGGGAADVLSAGAGNDIIRGLAGRDNITTGAGNDSVRYTTAATSAAAAGAQMDIITDFTAGTDKINLLGDGANGGLLLGVTITAATAAVATMGAVVTSATNVGTLTELYTAIGTSLAALGASAADGTATVAQVITFTAGTQAGTYLVINDRTAGFNGANDIVVNLTGLTGTFSAGDFTFLNA